MRRSDNICAAGHNADVVIDLLGAHAHVGKKFSKNSSHARQNAKIITPTKGQQEGNSSLINGNNAAMYASEPGQRRIVGVFLSKLRPLRLRDRPLRREALMDHHQKAGVTVLIPPR